MNKNFSINVAVASKGAPHLPPLQFDSLQKSGKSI